MDYYEKIKKEIEPICADVGLVILNAGVCNMGEFSKVSSQQMQAEIDANVYHVVAFAKKLLPGLEARSQRSALVTVSSVAATCPIPVATTYSATKAFVSFFTMGLMIEVINTDIMLFTPGYISTPMLGGFKPLMRDTPDDCSRAALRDLSKQQNVSSGTFFSKLTKFSIVFCSDNLPRLVWNTILSLNSQKQAKDK